MKNSTILFIIIIFISSCNQSTDNTTERKNQDGTTNEVTDIRCDTISSENVYELKDLILNVSNDDEIFTSAPFSDWSQSYVTVENRHNPEQTDTVYTLTNNDSFLEIYKVNAGKSILYKFKLNSKNYNYLNNLTRENIKGRIGSAEYNCDIITIESPEVPSFLTFIFRENNVTEVKFNGYLD